VPKCLLSVTITASNKLQLATRNKAARSLTNKLTRTFQNIHTHTIHTRECSTELSTIVLRATKDGRSALSVRINRANFRPQSERMLNLRSTHRDSFLEQLGNHGATRTRLMMLENGCSTASAFLHMRPTHGGLTLNDELIEQGILVRALMPIDIDALDCRQCGEALTYDSVLHPESCTQLHTVARATRHDAVRDIIVFEFNKLGGDKLAVMEPGLGPGRNPPRADWKLSGGIGQLAAVRYMDLRITAVTSNANVARADAVVRLGAEETEYELLIRAMNNILEYQSMDKLAHYARLRAQGAMYSDIQVSPFVMSTSGAFHEKSWEFIKANFKRTARKRVKEKITKALLRSRSTLNRVYWM
jgi:hypothetical protein